MKKAIYSLVITMAIALSSITVYASSGENINTINIEQLSSKELNDAMVDIIESALNQDDEAVLECREYFTNNSFEDYRRNIVNSGILSGTLVEKAFDIVTPSNSDTDDTVIMCNIRISDNVTIYNKLYLFEFHINEAGSIYGFNVWAY